MKLRLVYSFSTLVLFAGVAALAATRPPWTESHVVGSPDPPAPFTVQRLFPKLSFQHPVDLALAPGSERWFLLEQGGKLFSFSDRPDVERADLVFDFSKAHSLRVVYCSAAISRRDWSSLLLILSVN